MIAQLIMYWALCTEYYVKMIPIATCESFSFIAQSTRDLAIVISQKFRLNKSFYNSIRYNTLQTSVFAKLYLITRYGRLRTKECVDVLLSRT